MAPTDSGVVAGDETEPEPEAEISPLSLKEKVNQILFWSFFNNDIEKADALKELVEEEGEEAVELALQQIMRKWDEDEFNKSRKDNVGRSCRICGCYERFQDMTDECCWKQAGRKCVFRWSDPEIPSSSAGLRCPYLNQRTPSPTATRTTMTGTRSADPPRLRSAPESSTDKDKGNGDDSFPDSDPDMPALISSSDSGGAKRKKKKPTLVSSSTSGKGMPRPRDKKKNMKAKH